TLPEVIITESPTSGSNKPAHIPLARDDVTHHPLGLLLFHRGMNEPHHIVPRGCHDDPNLPVPDCFRQIPHGSGQVLPILLFSHVRRFHCLNYRGNEPIHVRLANVSEIIVNEYRRLVYRVDFLRIFFRYLVLLQLSPDYPGIFWKTEVKRQIYRLRIVHDRKFLIVTNNMNHLYLSPLEELGVMPVRSLCATWKFFCTT